MARSGCLGFVAAAAGLAFCGAAHGQTPPGIQAAAAPALRPGDMRLPEDLGASTDRASPQGADEMAMPDDLGAPLAGATAAAPTPRGSAAGRLSVDSPIVQIASDPEGKAVLERTLPGLCERPEYSMFKGMSLRRLAAMSSGRITEAKLDVVQADLGRLGPAETAPVSPPRGVFYPITHTASSSVRYGGRQIRQLSHAIYRRVTLVIAAL